MIWNSFSHSAVYRISLHASSSLRSFNCVSFCFFNFFSSLLFFQFLVTHIMQCASISLFGRGFWNDTQTFSCNFFPHSAESNEKTSGRTNCSKSIRISASHSLCLGLYARDITIGCLFGWSSPFVVNQVIYMQKNVVCAVRSSMCVHIYTMIGNDTELVWFYRKIISWWRVNEKIYHNHHNTHIGWQ